MHAVIKVGKRVTGRIAPLPLLGAVAEILALVDYAIREIIGAVLGGSLERGLYYGCLQPVA